MQMIQNYKIVTLCGSTRFKEQFMEAQKRLTLEGCIVISVGLFGHSGDDDVWKPGVLVVGRYRAICRLPTVS